MRSRLEEKGNHRWGVDVPGTVDFHYVRAAASLSLPIGRCLTLEN